MDDSDKIPILVRNRCEGECKGYGWWSVCTTQDIQIHWPRHDMRRFEALNDKHLSNFKIYKVCNNYLGLLIVVQSKRKWAQGFFNFKIYKVWNNYLGLLTVVQPKRKWTQGFFLGCFEWEHLSHICCEGVFLAFICSNARTKHVKCLCAPCGGLCAWPIDLEIWLGNLAWEPTTKFPVRCTTFYSNFLDSIT